MNLPITKWVAFAPADARWIPLNENGTLLYDRDNGSTGFASPTPEGEQKFRAMFRAMAMKARAAGTGCCSRHAR